MDENPHHRRRQHIFQQIAAGEAIPGVAIHKIQIQPRRHAQVRQRRQPGALDPQRRNRRQHPVQRHFDHRRQPHVDDRDARPAQSLQHSRRNLMQPEQENAAGHDLGDAGRAGRMVDHIDHRFGQQAQQDREWNSRQVGEAHRPRRPVHDFPAVVQGFGV